MNAALPLGRRAGRPILMGVLNATPDSFSDGGLHNAPEAALAHALRLEAAGADWIDVGAESTRPGFAPVGPGEEWERLGPVLEAMRGKVRAPVSVDTRHAETARRAFAAGAAMLNDVGGLADPAMREFAQAGDFPVVLMHGMAHALERDEQKPAEAIARWFDGRIRDLRIDPARLVLDPGIGFGTTRAQDAALVRDPGPLARFGMPLLYGLSRKRVLAVLAPGVPDLDSASAVWSWHAWRRGASILRLHAWPATEPAEPGDGAP